MILVKLRHLETHEIQMEGELAAAELDFDLRDEMVRAERPLHYDLTVEQLDEALLVTGSLRSVLDCECVRCLKKFQHRMVLEDWACHVPLTGEEKAPVENDCVDLTPFVREDMLLEIPAHPLCRLDCVGLKKVQALKIGGKDKSASSAWAELDKLKL